MAHPNANIPAISSLPNVARVAPSTVIRTLSVNSEKIISRSLKRKHKNIESATSVQKGNKVLKLASNHQLALVTVDRPYKLAVTRIGQSKQVTLLYCSLLSCSTVL